MRKLIFILVSAIIFQVPLYSQNFNWPEKVFKGYANSIAGEKFNYHSIEPDITHSLLIRANNTYKPIEWETEVVPENLSFDYVSFIWSYCIDATRSIARFDLALNDNFCLSFKNPAVSNLDPVTIKADNGVELNFLPLTLDVNGDPLGYMLLKVPKPVLIKGKAQKIKISAEDLKSQIYFMIFESSLEDKFVIKEEP